MMTFNRTFFNFDYYLSKLYDNSYFSLPYFQGFVASIDLREAPNTYQEINKKITYTCFPRITDEPSQSLDNLIYYSIRGGHYELFKYQFDKNPFVIEEYAYKSLDDMSYVNYELKEEKRKIYNLAVESGDISLVRFLEEQGLVGNRAVRIPIILNDIPMLEYLVEGDYNQNDALQYAIQEGNIDILDFLLGDDENLDLLDQEYEYFYKLAINEKQYEIINYLLQYYPLPDLGQENWLKELVIYNILKRQ